MSSQTITTICFDGQFWVAIIERIDGDSIYVARHVFGPEPSNAELLAWAGKGFDGLRFSQVPARVAAEPPANPKRRKREAALARRNEGMPSRARDALKAAAELVAAQRKSTKSETRQETARRRFADRTRRRKSRVRNGR